MLEFNENISEIVYGLVYFGLSAPLLVLYIVVIMAVYNKDKQKANMTLKIINLIHLCQSGQVIGQIIISPFLIFPGIQTKMDMFLRIVGSFMTMFYNSELPSTALLAVTRVLVFSDVLKTSTVPLFVKIFFFLLFSYLILIFFYSCTSGMYTFVSPAFFFHRDVPFAAIIQLTNLISNLISLAVSYTCYIILVYLIYVRKRGSSSAKSRSRELSIMIQYTIIVVYFSVSLIFWRQASTIFDLQIPLLRMTMNVNWIVGCALNPILILIFNKSIREESGKIMGFENTTRVKTVPITPTGSM